VGWGCGELCYFTILFFFPGLLLHLLGLNIDDPIGYHFKNDESFSFLTE
jgi:hypothetical protein